MKEEAAKPGILPGSRNGTGGTDGTAPRERPPIEVKVDALLDAVATANRIGRANQASIWRMENLLAVAFVCAFAFYLTKGRRK